MITDIGGQKPYYSVLYSSGRSHSNFLNIQLCSLKSYGDLIYFELGRNFRLEILIGWGEAETENDLSYFICLFCVYLFVFYLRSLKNVQCYLHFLNKESIVWMKTYNFFLPSCNRQSCMGPELSFFSRCNLINVRWNTLTLGRHSLLSSSHEKKRWIVIIFSFCAFRIQ